MAHHENADLHRDLGIDPVKTVNQNFSSSHLEQLRNHSNYEVEPSDSS